MENRESIEKILGAYEIVEPSKAVVAECIKNAERVMQGKRIRKENSEWFFVRAQIRYMKKEILLSFLISVMVLLVIRYLGFTSGVNSTLEIMVETAPFLLIPVWISFAKSKKYGMLELESASKCGLHRMLAIRALVNQGLALFMLCFIWFASGVLLNNFAFRALFFALISFEIATVCFLFFGRKSEKKGLFSVVSWMLLVQYGIAQSESLVWMNAIDEMVLGLITLLSVGVGLMMLYVYMKEISFEREDAGWNLGWTD